MKEFVYLYHNAPSNPLSPEQMQQQMQRWRDWLQELDAAGHLKDAGHPLEREGRLVKGKPGAVTDGPFAEVKDVIGGYTLVVADGIEQATELSKRCPIFRAGGTVEVRPVMAM
jgi:hypothetical protein